MSDNNASHTPAKQRDEFARNLASSLDESLLDIDEKTLRELEEKRNNIFSNKKKPHSKGSYIWSGLAAAIVIAIGIPVYFNMDNSIQSDRAQSGSANNDTDLANYYDAEPEMLEMMDMLIVLGELIEEDADAI